MEPSGKKVPTPDTTDYRRRSRVNMVAGAAIVALLLIGWASAKLFFDHEKLENCVASGRRNCVDLGVRPREGVYVPAH